jgi:hypothetical protein
MTQTFSTTKEGGREVRKAIILAVLAAAMLAIMAGPAFAEGYNNGNWNFQSGVDEPAYGDNAGIYVRQPQTADQIASPQGPHGGYTTSTNKCQDCHSTHYALGGFMLLRSDTRENACSFCHVGGGGSTVNIQMDNEYDATSAVATTTMGFGTGHTLGYKGRAPADIRPAFNETDGLACFSCHTPHGNSARVVSTPANPGAAIDVFKGVAGVAPPYNGVVKQVFLNHMQKSDPTTDNAAFLITAGPLAGMYDLNKPTQAQFTAISVVVSGTTGVPGDPADSFAAQRTARWGISPYAENMVFRRNLRNPLTGGVTDTHAITRPIFKQGKWLLLKNPNVKRAETTMTVYDWSLTGQSTQAWPDNNGNGITGALNTPTRDQGDGPPTRPLRGKILTLYPGDEIPNTAVGFRFWTSTDPASINAAYVNTGWVPGQPALGVDSVAWAGYARSTQTTKGLMNTVAAPKRDSARIYLTGGPYTAAEIAAIPAGDPRWATAADNGVNKYAMDWTNALGPADQMSLDEQESDRNQAYPFTLNPKTTGFGSVNEMCVDCHSGTAGASTQKANVFLPDKVGGGSYLLAFSHDAQPRH